MLHSASLKFTFVVCSLLLLGIPAVDAGTARIDFRERDKAILNRHVKKFVKNYIQENRISLHKIEQRSSSPFVIIDSILLEYNLPVHLK